MTHSISRRSVTTGLAAAVTAIPAVGFYKGAQPAPADDKLLRVLTRTERRSRQ